MATQDSLSSVALQSPARPNRTIRRDITSCAACYQRKVKCSKILPCSNCVKRGESHLCHLETRVVRPKARRADVGARDAGRRELSTVELELEVNALRRKLRQQEQLIADLQVSNSASSELSRSPSTSRTTLEDLQTISCFDRVDGTNAAGAIGQDAALSSDVARADSIVLGVPLPPALTDFRLARQEGSWTSPWARGTTSSRFAHLIPFSVSRSLFKIYANVTGWLGAAVRPADIMATHDEVLTSIIRGETVSYELMGLYFSYLANALLYFDDHIISQLGFTLEQAQQLPALWLDAALECLHCSDFLATPSLEALLAVTRLALVGNSYGATSHVATLSAACQHLASRLGLHLLVAEDLSDPAPGWYEREVGRRIWTSLMIREALSPESHRPHSLFLSLAQTSEPANLDLRHMDLDQPCPPAPLSHPTDSSHTIAMHRLCKLFRAFNSTFWSLPQAERLGHAQAYEAKLLHLLDFCPGLRRSEPYPTTHSWGEDFDHLPPAQYMWDFVIPSKRILIYRSFLSGRDAQAMEYARMVCLESARRIITMRRVPVPPLYLKPWSMTQDTVMAGAVLAVELSRSHDDPAAVESLRQELLEVVAILRASPTMVEAMWRRGADLLEKALSRPATTAQLGVSETVGLTLDLWAEQDAADREWLSSMFPDLGTTSLL